MTDKIGYLTEVDLFQGLPEEEVENIAHHTNMRQFKRGEIIYSPDDPGEVLFILKKGVVKIYRLSPDGKELTLAQLGPGRVFGEMALVGQGMYEAFAEVVEDCVLCTMSKTDVEQLLTNRPEVALRLIEIISARLSDRERALEDLAFMSVAGRLAKLLLQLAEEADGGDRQHVPKTTHQQLADIIGTSRETVTRTLHEFKSENLVRIEGHRVVLEDIEGLREIGG